MNVLLRKSLYQTNILPAMIAEIIEKNKNLLQSTGSYLVPGIDLIIGLMRVVENSAGDALFNAIHPIAFPKATIYFVKEHPVSTSQYSKLVLPASSSTKTVRNHQPVFSFPGNSLLHIKN